MKPLRLLLLIALLLPAGIAQAQTGKLAGTVTDEAGQPLPGVNVVLEGTTTGSVTDVDGYYVILNVTPGTYNVRASYIGFTSQIKEGVRVNIDLTTTLNFTLQEESVGLDEIVVEAREPIVRPDISANVANLTSEEMENLPVSGLEEVVGLQAGAEGLSIRGSGLDELNIMVDGMTIRDGRDNTPARNSISYAAIEAVQVQTGGFNAEYGNVRSGLINVVTKEGSPNRYSADLIVRYSPASKPYFGDSPNAPNGFHWRPYTDDAVAWTGTNSWDVYTQDQYPDFVGWEEVSERLMSDNDPSNDLTPQQAQEVWLWQHRKDFEITAPNYNVDGGVGGPVPLVSDLLGNLRFFASYRQTQTAYLLPQERDGYQSRAGQLKLTSDVAQGMKLTMEGMLSNEYGLSTDSDGSPGMYRSAHSVAGHLFSGRRGEPHIVFANNVMSPQDITRSMVGLKFTHTLSNATFYTVQAQRNYSAYSTSTGTPRDPSIVKTVGPMQLDEAPFGYVFGPANGIDGMIMGGNWASARDSSRVAVYSGRFDITSQVNRYAQLKAGLEYIQSHYRINNREVSYFPNNTQPITRWSRTPRQGAAYVQSKLEFQGLIANVGVRLDHYDPTGTWYAWDTYSKAFSPKYKFQNLEELNTIEEVGTEAQFYLSPRLGVSYPITERSKLFFNYGHFRQVLDPNVLFNVRMDNFGHVLNMGNPAHTMPRTVAYELGYEQNLFNQALLRLTGYYKALDSQPRSVLFENFKGDVTYGLYLPHNYEDIRGFEISLQKNVGRYFRGFANYTYMVVKRGNFGLARYYQNRTEQRTYERTSDAHYQSKPVPEPYARVSLEFFAPTDFGPQVAGTRPLGDWRLNLLGSWRAGDVFTWSGGGPTIRGLQNNVRWRDSYNLDLRLSKNFSTAVGDAQFYVDISNVLNRRHLQRTLPFLNNDDFLSYMESLHLPEEIFDEIEEAPYAFVPGNDRPGDFREDGVAFVPIEVVASIDGLADGYQEALYYAQDTGRYMQWTGQQWQEADAERVDQVLEDKAYIDMPNLQYVRFLYPRDITFGLRISF